MQPGLLLGEHVDRGTAGDPTALVNAGYVERILLGADVARRHRYRSYGGLPGLGYLGNSFLPRIRQRMGPEVLQQLIVQNPATYLAWS